MQICLSHSVVIYPVSQKSKCNSSEMDSVQ